MSHARSQWPRALAAALIGLTATGFAAPALAASVTPTLITQTRSQTCSSFAPEGSTWFELKVDPPGNGVYTFQNITITITNYDGKHFDWTSDATEGVDAVYVKAGSGGSYLYRYDPESFGDTQLQSPGVTGNGISHISFCWDEGGGRLQSEPDLYVTKIAYAESADVGDTVGFIISVLNQALPPNDAVNVTLNDTLPALAGGWSLGGLNASECGISSGVLSCTFANIAPQEYAYVEVYGTASADDCGTISNFVTVNVDGEIDPTNNEAWDDTYVRCADVGVEKTADSAAIDAGGTAGFSITVTSYGPDDAENVTLTDALPGVSGTWTLGGADAASCAIDQGTLTCDFGTLPGGATRTITLSAGTDATSAADCGTWTNVADVGARIDIDASNDESSADVYVTCADVEVEKTAADEGIDYGDELSFSITVTSNGPDAAENVTLTDTLPDVGAAWDVGGADADDCILADLALSCDFGTLASGATRTITLAAPADTTDACGSWLNEAFVAADLDIDASNDVSNASIYVTCADISLEKTAADDAIDFGDELSFTLTVTSNGPDAATGVTLTDTLPDVGSSWSLGGADAADCTLDGLELSCDFGTLEPSATRTVTLTADADTTDACGTWLNEAASSADVDTDPTNDSASATIHVYCADVGIAKTANAPSADAGGSVGFSLTVTSHGPEDAENVTLADTLPDVGAGWTLGGTDAADCAIDGLSLTCDFGTVEVDGTRTVTVSATSDLGDCGWVNNTATADARVDTNDTNDAASASTYVTCADVSVLKSGSPATIAYNGTATFWLNVTSHGPDAAENVMLTDYLPWTAAGWALSGADAASCTLVDRNVTCDFGTLESGAARSIMLTTTVGGANCGAFTNTAHVTARLDTNASNNASTATITITCVDPHTQGYWKNHASAWPVTSLVLGDESYNQAQLLKIFSTAPGSGKKADASLILAHQLIAAKLNVAKGAPGDVIGATITAADALLAPYTGKLPYNVSTTSATGSQMVALAKILDAYNNGLLT